PVLAKPDSEMLTNVESSSNVLNVHSTVVSVLYPRHSIAMCAFGSTTLTVTGTEWLYISQSHCSCLPGSSRPLLFVNQNFDVISGLTKASKTSPTGRRISIPALAAGAAVRTLLVAAVFLAAAFCLGAGAFLPGARRFRVAAVFVAAFLLFLAT